MKTLLKNNSEFISEASEWAAGLFVFIFYLFTLAPGVTQIDSGELAAVQTTLGIAHPTGYPLFTMTGLLFQLLPLPFSHIFRANLLAALWCSLGVVFFVKSVKIVFTHKSVAPAVKIKSGKQSKNISPAQVPSSKTESGRKLLMPAIAGGIFLAFSKTYWLQSTSVEVYSLQVFLFAVIIFFILKAYFSAEDSIRNWLYAAIALAFGFGNHMTTLLLLPSLAFLFFAKEKFTSAAFRKAGLMLLVFFPVLILIYLYLPARALFNPELNWGNPVNFGNFWNHFTGKQYRVWLFASGDAARMHLKNFLNDFPSEFTIAGLALMFAGCYELYRHNRKIFYFTIILFIFTVGYSINYDIVDLDSYFLAAYIAGAVFISFGFIFLGRVFILYKIKEIYHPFIFLLPAIFTIYSNFGNADRSGVNTYRDYTTEILKHAKHGALVLSYQWDYFISPSYYFQFAESYRKDVAVVDKELLRRSWYYNQLERNHPGVIKNLKPEIEGFLTAVRPFERDGNYSPETLEKYYREVMTKLVSVNIDEREVFIGIEIFQNEMARGEFTLPDGVTLVPDLFMFRAVKGNDYVPAADPDFTIRFPETKDRYTESIEKFVAQMLIYRTYYEMQFNKSERARVYAAKLSKDFPDISLPPQILNLLK